MSAIGAALRRAGAWIVAALGAALLVLALLWRRALGQRDQARAERDGAQRSAERERELAAEEGAIETRRQTAGDIIEQHQREAEARQQALEQRLAAVEASRVACERDRVPARAAPAWYERPGVALLGGILLGVGTTIAIVAAAR